MLQDSFQIPYVGYEAHRIHVLYIYLTFGWHMDARAYVGYEVYIWRFAGVGLQ